MSDKIVIDTNLFLDDANIIFKLSKQYDKIVIPITVLTELDNHKYNPDLSYSARNAIYSILQFSNEYPDKLVFDGDEDALSLNDRRILKSAKEVSSDLATKDISMYIVSKAKGIETKLYDVVMNGIFHPYKEIDINKVADVFTFKQDYIDEDYENILSKLESMHEDIFPQDAWFFIFMMQEGRAVYIYANNPLKHSLERIDNKPKYRELGVSQHSTLKALDEYQVCALYALHEAPNVVLTGKWGSGKTLIGTAYALSKSDRKIFITRPPIGINHKYDIGYMPGDKDEKMLGWFAGFLSALYYLYANTRGQINYDHIKEHIFKDKFETIPINAIQGMSLLEGDVFIADEVQLIDIDYLSMVLSRASKGSKLILLGDLQQTYGVVRPSESGLLKLLRSLPHRSIAYVELKNSHRSELLEIADKLQDKTIM